MSKKLNYLIYDIETVTDKKLLQRVLYPGREGQEEETYREHLLELAKEGRDFVNPSFHRPITIAAIAVNADFELAKIGLLGKDKPGTRGLVEHFWHTYNEYRPVLVDFNGKGFDMRVLELWAFRLGIAIDSFHFGRNGPRYRFSDDVHFDLHEFLSNFGAIRWRGGLNLFSKILGKPGKMETQGHMVQDLFDQGRGFEIDDYCLSDAMDTYFVFLRTLVIRGIMDLEREKALVEAARDKMEEMKERDGYFKSYLANFEFWDPEQG
jgi:hypothetical protein